jgi:hypothetical protein
MWKLSLPVADGLFLRLICSLINVQTILIKSNASNIAWIFVIVLCEKHFGCNKKLPISLQKFEALFNIQQFIC